MAKTVIYYEQMEYFPNLPKGYTVQKHLGRDWEFTGKIKYTEHELKPVSVAFEIQYKQTHHFIFRFWKKPYTTTYTRWMDESILIVKEVATKPPVDIIIDCN